MSAVPTRRRHPKVGLLLRPLMPRISWRWPPSSPSPCSFLFQASPDREQEPSAESLLLRGWGCRGAARAELSLSGQLKSR